MATSNNMSTRVDEGGMNETRVQTVDHQSPAGQGQMEKKRDVEVIHLQQPSGERAGGVAGGAAAAVANTIQSVKDAVSGTNASDESKKE